MDSSGPKWQRPRMNPPLICQYRQSSGRSNMDCVVIGRRFLESVGPRGEDGTERDHYIIINEPAQDGLVTTHTLYQFQDFLTGLWRADAGHVFVTGAVLGGVYLFREIMDTQRGSEKMQLPDVTPEGVWGLDDSHVYVWGTRMDAGRNKTYPVFMFDGSTWSELPTLPHPCNKIHGTAPDCLYAVGWNGMIARWNGSAWDALATPFDGIITDVHVESPTEQYAVTLTGALLEGSGTAWEQTGQNPLGATPFSCVAKFRGEVYIGANEVGLMKRTVDGGVAEFKPKLGAVHLEARETLIITCATRISGSGDGERFASCAVDAFAKNTANSPLAGLR